MTKKRSKPLNVFLNKLWSGTDCVNDGKQTTLLKTHHVLAILCWVIDQQVIDQQDFSHSKYGTLQINLAQLLKSLGTSIKTQSALLHPDPGCNNFPYIVTHLIIIASL